MEEDAAILKYAATKGIPALARAMGKSNAVTYTRYAHLKALTKAKK
jgi:hypothetical protein